MSPSGREQFVLATRREEHPEGIPVFNFEVDGFHTYFVAAAGTELPPVWVHNSECGLAAGGEHFAEWELRGPRGGLIAASDEISGAGFALPAGRRLSFPEQAWYTHTEGKIIADLWVDGQLKAGRNLIIDGVLPPCKDCKEILEWASKRFKMQITYFDELHERWIWHNGKLIVSP